MNLDDHLQEAITACDRLGESLEELKGHLVSTDGASGLRVWDYMIKLAKVHNGLVSMKHRHHQH